MCAECQRLKDEGVDHEKAIREMDEAGDELERKILAKRKIFRDKKTIELEMKADRMANAGSDVEPTSRFKNLLLYAEDRRPVQKPYRPGWIGRKIGWWVRYALQGLFNLARGSYDNSVALLDSMNNVLEIERNVAMAVRTMQTELTLLKVQMNTMVRAFDALNNRVQNLEQGQKMLLDAESTGEVYDFSPEGVAKGEMVTRLMKDDGLSQDEAELEADEVIR